jgi:hypothetical protein
MKSEKARSTSVDFGMTLLRINRSRREEDLLAISTCFRSQTKACLIEMWQGCVGLLPISDNVDVLLPAAIMLNTESHREQKLTLCAPDISRNINDQATSPHKRSQGWSDVSASNYTKIHLDGFRARHLCPEIAISEG